MDSVLTVSESQSLRVSVSESQPMMITSSKKRRSSTERASPEGDSQLKHSKKVDNIMVISLT